MGDLFGQVLGLCAKAGLLRAGTIAVDGTKLSANASLEATRTIEGLREQARRAVAEAGEVDAHEDRVFGDRRGDELPEALVDPARRASRIKQLLDELEAERAEAEAAQAAKVAAYEAKVAAGRRPTGKPPGRASRRDANCRTRSSARCPRRSTSPTRPAAWSATRAR